MANFLIYFFFVSLVTAQTCYWPNGQESGQTACPTQNNQTDSVCCGTQTDGTPAYCLTNGLCLSDFKVWRGSCTDKTWGSDACPPSQYCSELNKGGPFQLTACFNSPDGLLFGCYDCTSGNFSVNPGSFLLSPGQKQALGLVTSTASVSSTAGPISSTTAPSAMTTGVSAAAAAASSSAADTARGAADDSTQKTIIGVGAGLGAALGCSIGIILVLAYLLRREKKKVKPGQAIQSSNAIDFVPKTEMTSQQSSNSHVPRYPGQTQGYHGSMLSGQTMNDSRNQDGLFHEIGPDAEYELAGDGRRSRNL